MYFSAYRGYKDRKDVSKLKLKAEKMETKMIYFLQQVLDGFVIDITQ